MLNRPGKKIFIIILLVFFLSGCNTISKKILPFENKLTNELETTLYNFFSTLNSENPEIENLATGPKLIAELNQGLATKPDLDLNIAPDSLIFSINIIKKNPDEIQAIVSGGAEDTDFGFADHLFFFIKNNGTWQIQNF